MLAVAEPGRVVKSRNWKSTSSFIVSGFVDFEGGFGFKDSLVEFFFSIPFDDFFLEI